MHKNRELTGNRCGNSCQLAAVTIRKSKFPRITPINALTSIRNASQPAGPRARSNAKRLNCQRTGVRRLPGGPKAQVLYFQKFPGDFAELAKAPEVNTD